MRKTMNNRIWYFFEIKSIHTGERLLTFSKKVNILEWVRLYNSLHNYSDYAEYYSKEIKPEKIKSDYKKSHKNTFNSYIPKKDFNDYRDYTKRMLIKIFGYRLNRVKINDNIFYEVIENI
jgi:hypothetical protein